MCTCHASLRTYSAGHSLECTACNTKQCRFVTSNLCTPLHCAPTPVPCFVTSKRCRPRATSIQHCCPSSILYFVAHPLFYIFVAHPLFYIFCCPSLILHFCRSHILQFSRHHPFYIVAHPQFYNFAAHPLFYISQESPILYWCPSILDILDF